ncbi:MAG TPA: hypothetical protein VFU97_04510, partial [Xanthobacteraceae bacterium]|nr:hypothetical protein [Xanthobacteraceae bacterium]
PNAGRRTSGTINARRSSMFIAALPVLREFEPADDDMLSSVDPATFDEHRGAFGAVFDHG